MSNETKARQTKRIQVAVCEHLGLDANTVESGSMTIRFGHADVRVTVTAAIPSGEFAELVGSIGEERDVA